MMRGCAPLGALKPISIVSTGVAVFVALKIRTLPAVPMTGGTLKVIFSGVSTQIPELKFAGNKLEMVIPELTINVTLVLETLPAALKTTTAYVPASVGPAGLYVSVAFVASVIGNVFF